MTIQQIIDGDDLLAVIEAAVLAASSRTVVAPYVAYERAYACSINGCDRNAFARHMCNAHYLRSRNGGDMNAPIRGISRSAVCKSCDAPLNGKGGWGLCSRHYKKSKANVIKQALVAAMGGQCSRCNQVVHIAAFDFHHRGNKQDTISDLLSSGSLERISAEASKCVLMCANCHRVEHFNEH